jgi:hypothetical protein
VARNQSGCGTEPRIDKVQHCDRNSGGFIVVGLGNCGGGPLDPAIQLRENTCVGESDDLLDQLKAGDASASRTLVRQHYRTMIGLAHNFVGNRATAEEVVQETWLAVIAGLSSFDGRSTLKNWIFGIPVNLARSRTRRDRRTISFTDLGIGAEPTRAAAILPSR